MCLSFAPSEVRANFVGQPGSWRGNNAELTSDTFGIVIVAAVVDVDGTVAVAVPVKRPSRAADAAAARAVLLYRFEPCRNGNGSQRCGYLLSVSADRKRLP